MTVKELIGVLLTFTPEEREFEVVSVEEDRFVQIDGACIAGKPWGTPGQLCVVLGSPDFIHFLKKVQERK